MSRIRGKLNRILILMLAVVLLSTTAAWAAPACSLRVTVLNEGNQPVSQFNMELFCVASSTGGTLTLESEFRDLDMTAEQLLADIGPERAEEIYQYICARELEGDFRYTSAQGHVDFTGLEQGIYLVLERGGQSVAFRPFLVALPSVVNGQVHHSLQCIPKTSQQNAKTLLVAKIWDDDMNAAGKRPDSITVTVLRDAVPMRQVVLSDENMWQHTFYMLPNTGAYTVVENSVSGYEATYTPVHEGFLILNRYTGAPGDPTQQGSVSVVKVWQDEDDKAGKRPDAVTVQLIRDGSVVQTVVLSQDNFWQFTFTRLDTTAEYTVKEIAVGDYTAVYSGNAATGVVITNTYTEGTTEPGTPPDPEPPVPELIDIPVKVLWVDENNAAGKRPDVVTLNLLSAGSIVSAVQTSEGERWQGAFADVPANISYSVWQNAVEDYTTTYSGNATDGYVITNTYTGTTDPGVPPGPEPPEVSPDVTPTPSPGVGPDKPDIPQTGVQILPVYLLMAAGILLILLGVIDLIRGRRRT